MSNKFLDQYPQLWVPKPGDKIKIVKLLDFLGNPISKWDYSIGDTGVIVNTVSNNVLDIVLDPYKYSHRVYRDELKLISHGQ